MAREKSVLTVNEVLDFVKDCTFPCTKEQLIAHATRKKAPENVIHALQIMRPEKKFDNLDDVREGLLRERQFQHR